MNLREEFPDIAKFIDELREYFPVDQPTYLEGHGIKKGKLIDMSKAYEVRDD
jgi:hypothetical protein